MAILRIASLNGITETGDSRAAATLAAATFMFQSVETSEARNAARIEGQTDFMGLTFGVGIGISYAEKERITPAELAADGTIRATATETQEPRVILETHYYGLCRAASCKAGKFGVGPFFGIVAKDDKLISAAALGIMAGWRDGKEQRRGLQGFFDRSRRDTRLRREHPR